MAAEPQSAFRQGFCRAPGCGLLFLICSHCDRGQVYCGSSCRGTARRLQCRAANLRHQQSEEGRLDHRDRQRAYRGRLATGRVTDQGSQAPLTYDTVAGDLIADTGQAPSRACLSLARDAQGPFQAGRLTLACSFCGRLGRFINPFSDLE
jgi:hypothetical protein